MLICLTNLVDRTSTQGTSYGDVDAWPAFVREQ